MSFTAGEVRQFLWYDTFFVKRDITLFVRNLWKFSTYHFVFFCEVRQFCKWNIFSKWEIIFFVPNFMTWKCSYYNFVGLLMEKGISPTWFTFRTHSLLEAVIKSKSLVWWGCWVQICNFCPFQNVLDDQIKIFEVRSNHFKIFKMIKLILRQIPVFDNNVGVPHPENQPQPRGRHCSGFAPHWFWNFSLWYCIFIVLL